MYGDTHFRTTLQPARSSSSLLERLKQLVPENESNVPQIQTINELLVNTFHGKAYTRNFDQMVERELQWETAPSVHSVTQKAKINADSSLPQGHRFEDLRRQVLMSMRLEKYRHDVQETIIDLIDLRIDELLRSRTTCILFRRDPDQSMLQIIKSKTNSPTLGPSTEPRTVSRLENGPTTTRPPPHPSPSRSRPNSSLAEHYNLQIQQRYPSPPNNDITIYSANSSMNSPPRATGSPSKSPTHPILSPNTTGVSDGMGTGLVREVHYIHHHHHYHTPEPSENPTLSSPTNTTTRPLGTSPVKSPPTATYSQLKSEFATQTSPLAAGLPSASSPKAVPPPRALARSPSPMPVSAYPNVEPLPPYGPPHPPLYQHMAMHHSLRSTPPIMGPLIASPIVVPEIVETDPELNYIRRQQRELEYRRHQLLEAQRQDAELTHLLIHDSSRISQSSPIITQLNPSPLRRDPPYRPPPPSRFTTESPLRGMSPSFLRHDSENSIKSRRSSPYRPYVPLNEHHRETPPINIPFGGVDATHSSVFTSDSPNLNYSRTSEHINYLNKETTNIIGAPNEHRRSSTPPTNPEPRRTPSPINAHISVAIHRPPSPSKPPKPPIAPNTNPYNPKPPHELPYVPISPNPRDFSPDRIENYKSFQRSLHFSESPHRSASPTTQTINTAIHSILPSTTSPQTLHTMEIATTKTQPSTTTPYKPQQQLDKSQIDNSNPQKVTYQYHMERKTTRHNTNEQYPQPSPSPTPPPSTHRASPLNVQSTSTSTSPTPPFTVPNNSAIHRRDPSPIAILSHSTSMASTNNSFTPSDAITYSPEDMNHDLEMKRISEQQKLLSQKRSALLAELHRLNTHPLTPPTPSTPASVPSPSISFINSSKPLDSHTAKLNLLREQQQKQEEHRQQLMREVFAQLEQGPSISSRGSTPHSIINTPLNRLSPQPPYTTTYTDLRGPSNASPISILSQSQGQL